MTRQKHVRVLPGVTRVWCGVSFPRCSSQPRDDLVALIDESYSDLGKGATRFRHDGSCSCVVLKGWRGGVKLPARDEKYTFVLIVTHTASCSASQ